MAKPERAVVHFAGRVQGVGFRYTALDIARGFHVTGYVRNLHDGRVEVVAEGEPAEVVRFLSRIKRDLAPCIRRETEAWQPATEEFKDFLIQHG